MATALFTLVARAGETVELEFPAPSGGTIKVEAVLRKPATKPNGQAILLLHHGGGFSMGTTGQYADLFTAAGYVTLEPKLFERSSNIPPPLRLYATMAASLRFLSRQSGVEPDKVSAMGLSLGAILTINAASEWFYERYRLESLRFHRLAALYPVCWMMSEATKGRTQGIRPFNGLPSNFLQRLAGVPLLILAGGKDDYDSRNPAACVDFVAALPDARQSRLTQVKVYPEATHGWDHGRTYEFEVQDGCAMRATCWNRNVASPEIVEKAKRDLLEFFGRP